MLTFLLIATLTQLPAVSPGDKAGPSLSESEAPRRAPKPPACVDAELSLKAAEREARACESDVIFVGGQMVPARSCSQEFARRRDAECRKELACTPSTKDPKECNSATPRG